ncbi:MAG: polysaccharide deacetylase family protein [Candidatus Microgenomates bacterium]|jgi:peptidoglycan/xylan/chitin deacetylase (PgdA/CDA1 family)
MLDKKNLPIFGLVLIVIVAAAYLKFTPRKTNTSTPTPLPSEASAKLGSPTPSPTPKPLTFAQMNSLYGPCVFLPTLMYHHIQDAKAAADKKQTALTVDTDFFRQQMQYLKDKGYVSATANDLINFFNNGTKIPAKSILITIDDGYDDFYLNALPILREMGFTATVFVPTGLVNNPGYLSWDQIESAAGQGIFFANHTWSHKNVQVAQDVMVREITTADTQLSEKGLNNPKVFAYPYGFSSVTAEKLLTQLGYQLAFTTNPGSILCKAKHFDLPRVRIGNGSMSRYGF